MRNRLIYSVFILIILGIGIYLKNTEKKNIVEDKRQDIKFELIDWEEENIYDRKIIDINLATEKDFIDMEIRKIAIEKIFQYKNLVGGIDDIENLIYLKGVGEKTLEKLEDNFFVEKEDLVFKKVEINKVNSEILLVIGIEKKELRKIEKYKEENGKIYSSLDILNLLGENRYNIYKDRFVY